MVGLLGWERVPTPAYLPIDLPSYLPPPPPVYLQEGVPYRTRDMHVVYSCDQVVLYYAAEGDKCGPPQWRWVRVPWQKGVALAKW